MSRCVNKAILIGNIGKIEEKYFGSDLVVNLSLATNGRNNKVQWHTVSIYGKLAEVAKKYFTKGVKLYVEGEIRYNKRDTGYFTEIRCSEFEMLSSKDSDQNASQPKDYVENDASKKASDVIDNLPF